MSAVRIAPVLLAVVALASACSASSAQTTDQARAELPVLGHDAAQASDRAVPSDAGAMGAEPEPEPVSGTVEEPPTSEPAPQLAVPGLPASIPIGTTYVATALVVEGTVSLWSAPDLASEPAWSLAVPTEFGGPRHFAVIDQTESSDGTTWLQVQVPVRPNGSIGWIPAADVTLAPVTTRMEIDLSDRSVIVWDGDDVVLDTTGAIGADPTPTPTGTYYIRDQFPWDPESVYGPWVFALSSYSEVIDQINGGDAVVAIHGTRNNSVLGQAVSLGCIRLDNDVLTELASLVEPGTPVEVVP